MPTALSFTIPSGLCTCHGRNMYMSCQSWRFLTIDIARRIRSLMIAILCCCFISSFTVDSSCLLCRRCKLFSLVQEKSLAQQSSHHFQILYFLLLRTLIHSNWLPLSLKVPSHHCEQITNGISSRKWLESKWLEPKWLQLQFLRARCESTFVVEGANTINSSSCVHQFLETCRATGRHDIGETNNYLCRCPRHIRPHFVVARLYLHPRPRIESLFFESSDQSFAPPTFIGRRTTAPASRPVV